MPTSKKRERNKTKRISFRTSVLKRKKKQKAARPGPSLTSIFKVSAIVCVSAGIVIGLFFLERYVEDAVPVSEGKVKLQLVGVPTWADEPLKEAILAIARGDGEVLKLDEDAALSVQHNIERSAAWLVEVKVRATHDGLRIEGRWRKPIALVKSGLHKFYVDSEQVVLDFVPLRHLPIVEVKGLSLITANPPAGEAWQRDELAAAITILGRLDEMDQSVTPDKPLLSEIDRIDVSNFSGREDARHPHIVLYTKDNTEIIWGAEVGKWQHHLESTDEQKLAKLYGYYKEYGTLSGGVKYINLRDPQDKIPLPIDKY